MTVEKLITDHIDIWSSALRTRSTAGRGTSGKIDLYGIKKLRELILELAVRGKLVPQDPNDEPASELLKRIAAEKAELVKQGKIKKQKPLPEISEDEKPFELPVGWEWCRFGSLPIMYSTGLDRGKSQQSSENMFKYFKMNNILNSGGFDLTDMTRVNATQDEVEQYSLKENDFLFNTRNSKELVGKTCVFTSTGQDIVLYNNNILRAVFLDGILSYQIDIWMKSSSGKAELEKIKSGTTNVWAIYQGKLELLFCLIPPLAEQYRIVAKVDELMLLCDQLEQQSLTSLQAHSQLVETLLSTLPNSQNAEELAENWARISQHFDTLFTTEASIDALKQTILQLAVMGKLVPQDPTDEPASELLKRIEQEKAQLVKEGKIKKQKPLPLVCEEDNPFELPIGWSAVRLNQVAFLTGGFAYKSTSFINEKSFQVLRMGNIRPDELRLNENPVFIPQVIAEQTSDYELLAGDIVLTMTGTKGKRDYLYSLIIPDNLSGKLYLNQRICKVRVFVTNVKYVNLVLKSNEILNHIYVKSTGTANQANIGMGDIAQWEIPLPPLNEQNSIVNIVEKLINICETLKSRLQSAQQTQLYLADALTDAALN